MRLETEDGVRLHDVRPGSVRHVITRHTCYTIRTLFGRLALISGHPLYCPQPVLVTIQGSTWGRFGLRVGFIGCGMRLKFDHPEYQTSITTSPIREIRECPELESWTMASIV